MSTVAVIGPLFDPPEAAAERARLEQAGATVRPVKALTEEELITGCAEAEVVMAFAHAPFSERVFESLPRLVFLQERIQSRLERPQLGQWLHLAPVAHVRLRRPDRLAHHFAR